MRTQSRESFPRAPPPTQTAQSDPSQRDGPATAHGDSRATDLAGNRRSEFPGRLSASYGCAIAQLRRHPPIPLHVSSWLFLARAQDDLVGFFCCLKIKGVFEALDPAADIFAFYRAGDDQRAHALGLQHNGLVSVAIHIFQHVTQRLQAKSEMTDLPSRGRIFHLG